MLSRGLVLQQTKKQDTMHFLQTQLQNEKDLLAKRRSEGRNDLIAQMLLRRIEQEIKSLEIKIYERENARRKKENPKNVLTCISSLALVYHAKKGMHRLRTFYNRGHNTVSRVFKRLTLQAKGGLK